MNIQQQTGSDTARLRHALAEQLAAAGVLRSAGWRAAVEAVPRELFTGDFFTTTEPDRSQVTLYSPSTSLDPDQQLELVYSDDTWVTQLNGDTWPGDITKPRTGTPTSSSTMPSLVVRMWEDLDVSPGQKVLEIGTGTGYSTALGSHYLTGDSIWSIEVDQAVAERAAAALRAGRYHPHLVVGDGLAGYAPAAPYDRVIATCALRSIPQAWVEQTRPGGIILVTLDGRLGATGLAKLEVTGPETAEGAFIDPDVGFMPARTRRPEEVLTIPDTSYDAALGYRPTEAGPDVFDGPSALLRVIQLAAPEAHYMYTDPEWGMGLPEHLVIESDRSYVRFHRDSTSPSGWAVQQGGRRLIWDVVEPAIASWRSAGEPELTAFRIQITPDRQTISFGSEEGWELPPV
ncbi:ATP-grasp peptide maturase system methyltransferase [Kribbella sp. NPDC059898]|uniref:ATP-grasp peptide maturase system methyltransferase n=1 Tax=Kribbella sp. NPDC059898 TaxID=3346995 RepID=UPI0036543EDB